MMRIPALLLFAGVVAGAADLPREVLQLQRARVVMSTNLARLPNYTCLQTIERFLRPAPAKKPRMLDVVRLEVALVDGKELFAWPGSGRFSETEIGDMVRGGAIGNGVFALHAKALFQSNAPRFTYAGETLRGGRRTHKWDYVVAQNLSGWTVRVKPNEAVVGYHGSVLVDAATIDVVGFDVIADDIPPSLPLNGASMNVEYARVDIGGAKFLLPVRSDMEMIDSDGTVSSNRTAFSGCRQYSGESRLIFEDVDPAELEKPALVKVVDAPANVSLPLELAAPVIFEGAAVGDPVTAKLTDAVKLPEGVVLPKGAIVHGRLLTIREQAFVRNPGRVLGLRFFEAESPGIRVRFSATLEEVRTAHPGFRQPSNWGPGRPENEAVTGSMLFVHANVTQLPRGLRLVWRTTPLEAEGTQ